MKNLLSPIFLCLSLTTLSAQAFDFAPVGAKWYYSELNFALNTIPHITECVGKENYQGKWCSKLISSSVGPLPSPIYLYTQNDTVFFYSNLSNQFEMLYNFKAEVGDSWVVGGVKSFDNEGNMLTSDTIVVDSISTLMVSGELLKVWHIRHGFFYDWGSRIIEKMGNDGIFAPKYGLWDLELWGIRCFELPGEQYSLVSYPCDTIFKFISSAFEPSASFPIQVMPNPASTHTFLMLHEEMAGQSGTVAIFDAWGGRVRDVAFTAQQAQSLRIHLSDLAPGTYVYRVQMDGGALGSGRILVMR